MVSTYILAVFIFNFNKTNRGGRKKRVICPGGFSGMDTLKRRGRSPQNQNTGEGNTSLNPLWSHLLTPLSNTGTVNES